MMRRRRSHVMKLCAALVLSLVSHRPRAVRAFATTKPFAFSSSPPPKSGRQRRPLGTVPTTQFPPTRRLALPDAALSFAEFADVDAGIVLLQGGCSLFASCFGFGDALLAMPLLALLFHVEGSSAAPLVSCVSTLMILANLAVDARTGRMATVGRWKESAILIGASAVGVPLGVHALVTVDPTLIRAAVGALLVLYGAGKLATTRGASSNNKLAPQTDSPSSSSLSKEEDDDMTANTARSLWTLVLPFGFLAGVLGGAVAEPGPPAVVLSQLSKWNPTTQRVMLFRFFLPTQLLAIADYREQDLLTPFVVHQTLAAIPAVALAVALGTFLNRRIDPGVFDDFVSLLVVGLGLLCCSTALSGAA